jgi:endonuclease I
MSKRHAVRAAVLGVVVLALSASPALAAWNWSYDANWEADASYYSGLDGLWGSALKSALQSKLSSEHVTRSYENAQYMCSIVDADPTSWDSMFWNYDRVVTVYDNVVRNVGAGYNREHMWPNSRQDSSGSPPDYTDYYNLRFCDSGVNSSRSNSNYGGDWGGGGTTGYGWDGGYWYAGEEDKGDVARAMFYMATRYSHLDLVNGNPYAGYSGRLGDLDTLLQWHQEDPVNAYEMRKNSVVQTGSWTGGDGVVRDTVDAQGNRNPFVDNPEWVEYIFDPDFDPNSISGGNDTQLSVAAPAGDGSSTATVAFGRVIAGHNASQNVSLNKTGSDTTGFDATTAGAASCVPLSGSFSGGTQSVNLSIGTDTATAGNKSGTVTVENTATSSDGTGLGSDDGDDTINVSATVVDASEASFASGTDDDTLTLDFGRVRQGLTASDAGFSIYNLVATAGYTASLDLDTIDGSGDVSSLLTDLSPFSDLAAGGSAGFTASLDSNVSAGDLTATYTLGVSDEDIAGASAGADLVLTLAAEVMLLGDVDLDGDVSWTTIDASDVDALTGLFGGTNVYADVDDSGLVDGDDQDALIEVILDTAYGDTNLDGSVNLTDLTALGGGYGGSGGWASGDQNGDGLVNLTDLTALGGNYGFTRGSGASGAGIPEPASMALAALAGVVLLRRRG